ncbi:MAG: DHH family phosphoesterase [Clostridia bacterium]|nr:DHH family phosphoesterase [Clostridia bacterium]
MRKLTIDEAAARLASLERVVILFHARPDGDAIGSAFALRRVLALRGCRAACVCAHELPARLRFLAALDEDAQTSVLAAVLPEDLADAPVVSVDTAAPAQAGELVEAFLPRCVLMIDHHASGTPYADYCIDPAASATGELLCALLRRLCPDGLDPVAAAMLFAAIATDTGCFKYSNATAATHRAAADLLDAGIGRIIDPAELTRRLFDVKTAQTLRAEQLALANLRRFAGGRVVISTLTHAEREAANLRAEDTETMIDAIRVVEGCEIAAIVKQIEDGPTGPRYRASLRSTGPNVAEIAEKFGGGGHARAAGCTIAAPDLQAAIQALLEGIGD